MGANVSRAKQVSIAEDRRLGEVTRYGAPGWRLVLGKRPTFEADKSLMGFRQRGQSVLFRCNRRDCGRRVEPDLEALVRSGHGNLTTAHLHGALRCGHPLGCELAYPIETYPLGVPLIAFVGHDDVMITITCEGCQRAVTLPVGKMIDRLIATRRGDAATGINELGKRVRGPCRSCGGRAFTSSTTRA